MGEGTSILFIYSQFLTSNEMDDFDSIDTILDVADARIGQRMLNVRKFAC